MSSPRELIIVCKDPQSLRKIWWDKEGDGECVLTVRTGTVQSIKFISKKVLEIEFEHSTVLLDIRKEEFRQLTCEE